jgi:putative transposase
VQTLCRVMAVPVSSYSYHPQVSEELELREAIEAIAVEYPRYGYRRITAELGRRGMPVNHKHVLRVMREENLLVEVRRYCQTTNSQHSYGRYPNLVKQLPIICPDQVWGADLTSIRLERQFVYLAGLLDLFTRSIRGWELAGHLTEDVPKAALLRALQVRRPQIHHSDQGVQYAATGYIALLEAASVQISMAARGKPTENALVERFMRTLKEEEVSLHEYRDMGDARAHIAQFLEQVYMHKRVHSALGYVPPAEFEAQWLAPALGPSSRD